MANGKKVKGRKRHIMTDTLGLLLFAVIHSAGIQDRDGAPDVFRAIRRRFPWLCLVFADGGYGGDKLKARSEAAATGRSRSDTAKGFEVRPIFHSTGEQLDGGGARRSGLEAADWSRCARICLHPKMGIRFICF